MKRVMAGLLAVVGANAAVAGTVWPMDAAVDNPIGVQAGDQAVPLLAGLPDGSCYAGWFDNSGGSYAVRVQRLAPDGTKQWGPDGLLVSAHPQSSSLVGWDLIADSSGGVVVAFTDIRAGGDLDVYAYRISADQQFLWGMDGVAVSDDGDFEPNPKVCETSDGDFVVVWARLPNGAVAGDLRMQRITPGGQIMLAPGGVPIVTGAGTEKPGFCDIVPSSDGDVIVCWLRDIGTFQSPRHLRSGKFDESGAAAPGWPLEIFNASSLPIAYQPVLEADGLGGAVFAWHRAAGNHFDAFVQRVDAAGTLLFAPGGVLVSTDLVRQRFNPRVAVRGGGDEVLVFWDERNSAQSMWGVYGQRLSSAGARLWGESGRVLEAVTGMPRSFVRVGEADPGDGGAIVSWFESADGGSFTKRVRAQRVDQNGDPVWGEGGSIDVSSVEVGRDDLEAASVDGASVILIWADSRDDSGDIYGKRLNPDGALGPAAPACPGDLDGDGDTDTTDLNIVLSGFGCSGGGCPGDLDGDGDTDTTDLNIVLSGFGCG